mmetsp:Transcript_7795/g.18568  ORF Transcript_7795/g.18568 Transcript_7795/m.18568 type:complete len:123 (-) Transcript_7795:175-543(-)
MYRKLEPSAWSDALTSTYHAAFEAAQRAGLTTLAVPLLGAGACGAPKAAALTVAAEAAVSWSATAAAQATEPLTARFGVQDSSTAHDLVDELEAAIARAAADGGGVGFELAPRPVSERWALG